MPGITASPARLDSPSFLLQHELADPLQLKCAGRSIDHSTDQEFEDVETFCNPGGEAPGVVKQSFVITVLNSFGANGLYNLLSPLAGTRVSFAYLRAGSTAISEDNPEFSGFLYVPTPKIVNAGVRKFTEYDLDFKIDGAVLQADTPGAAVADTKHS